MVKFRLNFQNWHLIMYKLII